MNQDDAVITIHTILPKERGCWNNDYPSLQIPFFIGDAVAPGIGMEIKVPETGTIPKQKTITIFLYLYIRIPKQLKDCAMPSFHLTKSGLTVSRAMQPNGQMACSGS